MKLPQSPHTKIEGCSPFLNTEEAACYLNLKKSTLEAWRCRGGGPSFVRLGRAIRYRKSDLDWWVESRVYQNTVTAGEAS